jgi:lactoylglutathione lyase
VYVAFDADGFELGVYGREDMAKIVPSLDASSSDTSDHLLINLQVDDLAATITQLESKGVSFETDVHDQPDWGMRVVHLRDPEGNLLELFSILPGVAPQQ